MFSHNTQSLRVAVIYSMMVVTPLLGCGSGLVPEDMGGGNFDSQAQRFLDSQLTAISLNGVTELVGEVLDPSHIEDWNLGFMAKGTKIVVDLRGDNNNLSVGLFDQDEQVLMISHDRYRSKDPYCILEINEDLQELHLAVSSDPVHDSSGRYWVTLTHSDGHDFGAVTSQQVVLNFSGASNVSVGNLPAIDVGVFDAATLDSSWSELTEEMKFIVMDNMVRIYDGLDVEFFFADDPDLPEDEESTWVHFGAKDSTNVGLADSVDYRNRFKNQKAIVYTQNFAKYVKHGYDHEDLAQGFANVAAHELGHLLGLNHAGDPAGVMNVSPTVAALLAQQYFVDGPRLADNVFKTGYQDGADIVLGTVGGDWSVVQSSRRQSALRYASAFPNAKHHDSAEQRVEIAQFTAFHHCQPSRAR